MKRTIFLISSFTLLFFTACQGGQEKKEEFRYEQAPESKEHLKEVPSRKPSETIDLSTKGIGPVKQVVLPANIDAQLAGQGEQLFNSTCLVCHLAEKKMVGPAMKGITERRTPEWIMNMILNPQEMALKDSLANALLKEYNQSIMPYQGITEEQARAMLEYFRTL